ncbi:MAG: stage II sporulation protein M [Holophagales bacterium]|nr:stage II sporulation protein M [Holophagales bacterium]
MSHERFVARHRSTWDRTERLLDRLDQKPVWDEAMAELPALYRRCCHHLALVRQRNVDPHLEDRLHAIALRGYRTLYRSRHQEPLALLRLWTREFPSLVRARARAFWLASALFYGPALAMGLLVLSDPDAVLTLIGPERLAELEAMYRNRPAEERGAGADFGMFGFYVYNNISVAFRTFAAGLFAGIGTLFFLTFNGLYLGAVLAHMVHVQSAVSLTSFVITHGAFELTALVIAGVAGLELGGAVIAPGRRARGDALRRAGRSCAVLLCGITALLLVAAFVEAFWSSTAWVPPAGKYAVGSAAWIAVAAYLLFAGRRAPERDRADPDWQGPCTTGSSWASGIPGQEP